MSSHLHPTILRRCRVERGPWYNHHPAIIKGKNFLSWSCLQSVATQFMHQLWPEQIGFVEARHFEGIDLFRLRRMKDAILMVKLISIDWMPNFINHVHNPF